jgi:serine protease inhibitor
MRITSRRFPVVAQTLGMLLTVTLLGFVPIFSSTLQAPIAEGATSFAFKFASLSSQQSPKENMVLSPYGAFSILSLLSNGASGTTQAEILRMLGANPKALDVLNDKNKSDLRTLAADDPDLKLSVANAMFVDKEFSLLPPFTKVAEEKYAAQTQKLDFENAQEALTRINGWVNERTRGCIKEILGRLMKGDCVVLVNAVYFKGRWLNPFSTSATRKEPFHCGSGSDNDVWMMHKTLHLSYYAGRNFRALEIPYVNVKQSLFVILPDKTISPSDLLAQLDGNLWRQIIDGMSGNSVKLSLPKFHIEYSKELNPILNKMGMVLAFNPRMADFTKLSSERAYVSRVIQKTFMDVDEKGTEAAAATAITMTATAMPMPQQSIEFRVDRPFIVILRDNVTNEFLFMGAVSELPKAE